MPDVVELLVTLTIRPSEASDRDRVMQVVRDVGNFSAAEIETALELIDEWLQSGEASGYLTYVVENRSPTGDAADHRPMGYVCYGPTPLTQSTRS